jgi:hypothetical protein
MVSQSRTIADFLSGNVVSFYLEYYCPECNNEQRLLVDLEKALADRTVPAGGKCRSCGEELVLDELEASYDSVLETLKRPPLSPELAELLAALPDAAELGVSRPSAVAPRGPVQQDAVVTPEASSPPPTTRSVAPAPMARASSSPIGNRPAGLTGKTPLAQLTDRGAVPVAIAAGSASERSGGIATRGARISAPQPTHSVAKTATPSASARVTAASATDQTWFYAVIAGLIVLAGILSYFLFVR